MPDHSILGRARATACLSDGAQTWTLNQLKAAVGEWIEKLDALDVRVVAFDLPNSLEWVALDLALYESGRVAVPLPTFFSSQQQQHAIETSGAQLVVTSLPTDAAVKLPAGFESFRTAQLEKRTDITPVTLPAGTVLVTYTSGSTGTPKGACLSAQTLIDTAASIVATLADLGIEKHLSVLPMTLLLENVAGLFANLLNGSEIFVPALDTIGIRGSSNIDIVEFVEGLTRYSPDSIILVPALLLGVTAAAEFGLADFANLRFVAVGGGRVAADLLARASAKNIPVYEGYGLTECGSVVTLNTPTHQRAGSVGKLLPHVKAHIYDGELIVSAPRMLGYLGEHTTPPEQIATGDRVEIDADGFVSVHGRKKNIFITAYGRNISPEWIESELQNELAIGLAMVCGEAEVINTALIVPRGEYGAQDIETAIAQCNQRLPDYARIGRWSLMTWQDLDRAGGITGNGRLKRDIALAALETLPKHDIQGASIS